MSPIIKFIRNLLPVTPMGAALLVGIVVWIVNWAFSSEQRLFGSERLKLICDLASVLALIPLGWFAVRGSRWIVEHLLWRLRRRLIVTYLLIGALPLLLVLVLVGFIGYVLLTQTSVNLVARQLDGYLAQSRDATQSLGRELSALNAEQMRGRLQEHADALAPIFPDLRLSLFAENGTPLDEVNPPETERSNGGRLPQWPTAQAEFHGWVVERRAPTGRRIYACHIVKLERPAGRILQLKYPIAAELSEHLSRTTGLTVKPGRARLPLVRSSTGEPQIDLAKAGEPEEAAAEMGGIPVFVPITDWLSGERIEGEALWLDYTFLLPGSLWQRLQQFRTGSEADKLVFWLMSGTALLFALIALAAVVSAVFLTRSITGAVHHLYEGTQRVEAGDLHHEIPTTSRDQLGELAGSFNQMTHSVRDLLRVSAEKQRLDQEVRIAAEVQARLFPRHLPQLASLDFAPGLCIPARTVSGDYYDFLTIAPGLLGVVVADVCGKGLSAAMMMSNLQANLRSQVQAAHDARHDQPGAAPATRPAGFVSRIVQRVNRQMAASVMDASYVTLFYAEYDEAASLLRYTNAGHNPPLLLRGNGSGVPQVVQLDCGGTVIGMFADSEYEDAEISLTPGDVLVAYTDGLIEAHNPHDEEFGEDRLINLLTRHAALSATEIKEEIIAAVKQWTAGAEQEDDLTLVIFKKV